MPALKNSFLMESLDMFLRCSENLWDEVSDSISFKVTGTCHTYEQGRGDATVVINEGLNIFLKGSPAGGAAYSGLKITITAVVSPLSCS